MFGIYQSRELVARELPGHLVESFLYMHKISFASKTYMRRSFIGYRGCARVALLNN